MWSRQCFRGCLNTEPSARHVASNFVTSNLASVLTAYWIGVGPQSLRGLPNGFTSQQQLPQPKSASSRIPNGKMGTKSLICQHLLLNFMVTDCNFCSEQWNNMAFWWWPDGKYWVTKYTIKCWPNDKLRTDNRGFSNRNAVRSLVCASFKPLICHMQGVLAVTN
jgi:hypothetical protein